VGTPNLAIRSLAKPLEASSWAGSLLGPNTSKPRARSRSPSPAASGASGPTTIRSGSSLQRQLFQILHIIGGHIKAGADLVHRDAARRDQTVSTRGLWAIFQASACSRPPDPMMRIFMAAPFALVNRLGLYRRGNHAAQGARGGATGEFNPRPGLLRDAFTALRRALAPF
jgi:hypothetical protein